MEPFNLYYVSNNDIFFSKQYFSVTLCTRFENKLLSLYPKFYKLTKN